MLSERGVELDAGTPSRLSIAMEMPSGATSIPKRKWPIPVERIDSRGQKFWIVGKGPDLTDETALALVARYTNEMKSWNTYEGWIVLFENGKEISREHVRT